MKLQSILAAGIFAAITTLSFQVRAADAEKTPDAKAPAADVQADQKAKPHSHVEEKTGARQTAPDAKAAKPNAAQDKTKHYHPRDMK